MRVLTLPDRGSSAGENRTTPPQSGKGLLLSLMPEMLVDR